MKAIPSRVRIVLFSLAALLSVGLIFAGHYLYQLTADVEAPGLEAPNNLDAKELERKLKLLEEALKTSRRGFVRLSEVEINSYLHEHFPARGKETNAAPSASGCRLVSCRVDLVTAGAVVYSWVQVGWRSYTWELCWQRAVEVRQVGDHWELALTSMHVGRLLIPPRYWSHADDLLQAADRPFAQQYAWLKRLPNLEIRLSEIGQTPELRLYSFRDAGLLRQAQR